MTTQSDENRIEGTRKGRERRMKKKRTEEWEKMTEKDENDFLKILRRG